MRLYAIEVSDTDCLTLFDLLQQDGRADGLSAASAIDRGLSLQAKLITLTPAERDAILGVLDDPPDGLAELRSVLARNNRDRSQALAASRPRLDARRPTV